MQNNYIFLIITQKIYLQFIYKFIINKLLFIKFIYSFQGNKKSNTLNPTNKISKQHKSIRFVISS